MTPAPGFLTVSQVAAMFGVNPKTARRWGASGKLEASRDGGGAYLFRRDQCEALRRGEAWAPAAGGSPP
jgi:excisionase family DNA binding protein